MTALSVAYKAKQEHCLYVAFQDVEHFKWKRLLLIFKLTI
jgi:hypothetical protein